MQPQLRSILETIAHAETRELVAGVFGDLQRLLGYLDNVKELARAHGPADEAHFIFEAVRHELRAVFERILPSASPEPEGVRRALADAHDVLRNCFEQSTASLARLFRPEVDAAELFDDVRARRENSLRLYEDLEALLRSARYAEWHEGPEAMAVFSQRLELFRAESMRHLMEKDQETCRGFIEGMVNVRTRKAARMLLHRFACYLEILLRHVGMRSVLAEASVSAAA
jgi:hypothetical protein